MVKSAPKTETRVSEHTAEQVNERIQREIEARVHYYAQRLDRIEQRLNELDYEWDIERTLELNAASVSLLGLILGATSNRKWFLLPAVVGVFLAQHAIQGWCPPITWFRRMGIRTTREINEERFALKAIRGDFDEINGNGQNSAESAIEAVK